MHIKQYKTRKKGIETNLKKVFTFTFFGILGGIILSYNFFRDLSQINGLKNVIIDSFNHNNEEVKSAASYALGNISLGK